jgi:hypothetical protein
MRRLHDVIRITVRRPNRAVSVIIYFGSFHPAIADILPCRILHLVRIGLSEGDGRFDRDGCATLPELGNDLVSQEWIDERPWKHLNFHFGSTKPILLLAAICTTRKIRRFKKPFSHISVSITKICDNVIGNVCYRSE